MQIAGNTGECLMAAVVFLNVLTFCIYGLDKYKAKRGKWRIPEKTLLLLACLGGSVGALAGMYLFRHKTKKAKFAWGVPLIFIAQAVILFVMFQK